MSQWVQHISGQGEKWKVQSQYDLTVTDYWVVHNHSTEYRSALHLPKSEYRLCDPPEQWVDVTKSLDLEKDGSEASEPTEKVWAVQCLASKYRLRRIAMNEMSCQLHKWAFIIEKRVQP